MPKLVTIATFNAENLFARFKFRGKKIAKKYRPWTPEELSKIAREGWLIDKMFFEPANKDQRRITAQAILATKADIIALQEIENLDVLRLFNTKYLKSCYPYQLVIDSHDPRLIDVAVLSKYPFANIRTHQFAKNGNSFIFSRDCLEVEVDLGGGRVLPLFINHLKSMMGGRRETAPRRLAQAREVVRILKARFQGTLNSARFVVLGDLNDYLEPPPASQAIKALIKEAHLLNVVERLPKSERWTHYWAKEGEYRQLDYILLSQGLAAANPNAAPKIVRNGMPKRAKEYKGPWFKGVGQNKPKASDHCPVHVTLKV